METVQFLRIQEIRDRWKCGRTFVHKAIGEMAAGGCLNRIFVGRRPRIALASVERWEAAHAAPNDLDVGKLLVLRQPLVKPKFTPVATRTLTPEQRRLLYETAVYGREEADKRAARRRQRTCARSRATGDAATRYHRVGAVHHFADGTTRPPLLHHSWGQTGPPGSEQEAETSGDRWAPTPSFSFPKP